MSHAEVIALIEIFASAMRRSPHTIGRLASGSGDFYLRLKNGHDLTTRRANKVALYISTHWPPDLEWPRDIPRPSVSTKQKRKSA